MVVHSPLQTLAVPERSTLSAEFEAFWRNLPCEPGRLMPNRSVFLPERAPRFLRHFVLCEVPPDGAQAIRMRLIGSEFAAMIRRDVRGADYLEFLPPQYHEGAIASVRHIVNRPCGLWQVMPVHYERGYAHYIELTVFPLGPGPDGKPLLLVLTQPIPAPLVPTPTGDKVMTADTAVSFRYIDVGAGMPFQATSADGLRPSSLSRGSA